MNQKLKLHLVMDNYGTHKTPEVQSWLRKHPRFVCHFVPTSSSWLNLVERWFRELTDKAIRRGVFRSVPDLEKAIAEYLCQFRKWPAVTRQILGKRGLGGSTRETIKALQDQKQRDAERDPAAVACESGPTGSASRT